MSLIPYDMTYEVQAAIRAAQTQARDHSQAQVSPGHLLWGLLTEEAGLQNFLERMGKDVFKLRAWADFRIDHYPKSHKIPDTPSGDEDFKRTMKEADKIRSKYIEPYVTPMHVLEAICTPEVAYTADQLKRFPISPGEFAGQKEQDTAVTEALGDSPAKGPSQKGATNALNKYCDDITAKARQGRIDPVIGRDKQLKQLIEILGKRLSPNVLIIGEPGVGKTAIVGGLALKIQEGKVPQGLQNATIFELDVNGRLVAGAYKGEVEERLKDVLKGIHAFEGRAILFIDEIHVLLDEQGSVGAGAVNLLKPELARGELTVIGATTTAEYNKHIETDEAFRRRFTILKIDEPDVELATRMVVGLADRFEAHHSLALDRSSIPEAVRLSKRYLSDKYLPVSALELIDLTMSAVRLMNDTTQTELDRLEDEWKTIETGELDPDDRTVQEKQFGQDLSNRLSHILISRLQEQTESHQDADWRMKMSWLREWSNARKEEVNMTDIIAMVAYHTGIPMGKIQTKEQERLMKLEDHLRKRVRGQDHALRIVAEALRRSRAGLIEPNKPAAAFFFLGPTGTGKTELAKAIAEFLFNDESALLRFDMSEFKEEHSVALLYGSPPGYVGYKEGGVLVNKIRAKPYSVVLFDEIEKAHPSVYDIFLQILDEGQIHDKLDRKGDFTKSIIIFTSNVGAEWVTDKYEKGEIPTENELKDLIRSTGKFRPELLGRPLDIIPFGPITEEVAPLILDIHLKHFMDLLQRQKIALSLTEVCRRELTRSGFSPTYGARPLKETIRRKLGNAVSTRIVSGQIVSGDAVEVDWNPDNDEYIWTVNGQAGIPEDRP